MTAEKLLGNNIDGLREIINDDDLFFFYKGVVCEFAKEFAEYHVKEALKTASKNAAIDCWTDSGWDDNVSIIKNKILNAYSKDNIK